MKDDVNVGLAEVLKETEKALLVNLPYHYLDPVWVPKSVISDDSEVYSLKSGGGDLIIQRWWAEKEGLT